MPYRASQSSIYYSITPVTMRWKTTNIRRVDRLIIRARMNPVA